MCKVEWCEEKSRKNGFCGRHYQQMMNWGEIKRSRGDKNEIIKFNNHAEIVLYDINYDEKARAIIDLDDVEKCKPYKWVLRNDGYVSSKINNKGVKLHRFIVNTPKGKHTDHVNKDKLDNRKSNLKICTQSENNKNKNTYRTNRTGKRGVLERDGHFQVSIVFNKVKHYVGYYSTFEEAKLAREEVEIEFYGHILD